MSVSWPCPWPGRSGATPCQRVSQDLLPRDQVSLGPVGLAVMDGGRIPSSHRSPQSIGRQYMDPVVRFVRQLACIEPKEPSRQPGIHHV
jgi:hypothetical protein